MNSNAIFPNDPGPSIDCSDDNLKQASPEKPNSASSDIEELAQGEVDELPMDTGVLAWMQVLGSCILCSSTWGLTTTFGVFQAYYMSAASPLPTPVPSASAISWIGSIQLFLAMGIGAPVGIALDAGYLRSLIAAGTVLEVLGMVLTAQCTKYWQLFLAQGVLVGIGMGLLGVTSQAIIPLWFVKKRALCSGIAAGGTNVAGVAYSMILRHLFTLIGFVWAVRCLALILFVCQVFCFGIMRLREPPKKRQGPSFSFAHFRDVPYTIFVVGFVLMITAVYIPYFYIAEYAILLNLPPTTSSNLLAIMNAGALLGRIIPNYIADQIGTLTTLLPLTFTASLLSIFLYWTTFLPGLVVIALFYGFVSGSMTSLPPAMLANLTPVPSQIGARMGIGYALAAFGGLIGNPIAGALGKSLDRSGWVGGGTMGVREALLDTWVFCAVVLAVAGGFWGRARWVLVGWSREKV